MGLLRSDADEVGRHRGVEHLLRRAEGVDDLAFPLHLVAGTIVGGLELEGQGVRRLLVLRVPLVERVGGHVRRAQQEVRHEELLLEATRVGIHEALDAAVERAGLSAGDLGGAEFRVDVRTVFDVAGAAAATVVMVRLEAGGEGAGRDAVVGRLHRQVARHVLLPVFVRLDDVGPVAVIVAVHGPT